MAIFSGRVRDTAVRVNELTGLGFRWAAVRTLIGDVDVVADPAVVDGEASAGGVVIGSFWLSGRISTVNVEAESTPKAPTGDAGGGGDGPDDPRHNLLEPKRCR